MSYSNTAKPLTVDGLQIALEELAKTAEPGSRISIEMHEDMYILPPLPEGYEWIDCGEYFEARKK